MQGIRVPNNTIPAKDLQGLFRNKHLQLRGQNDYVRNARRFYNWPYHNAHQESEDPGPLYTKLSRITVSILRGFSPEQVTGLVFQNMRRWKDSVPPAARAANLYDELRPVIVRTMFSLLFERSPSEEETDVYVKGTKNFHDTLKGMEVLSYAKRARMHKQVAKNVREAQQKGLFADKVVQAIETDILVEHVGTAFFYSAVLQLLEGAAHVLAIIYENPETLGELSPLVTGAPEQPDWEGIRSHQSLDSIFNETLRLFPLIHQTNREASEGFRYNDFAFEPGANVILDFVKIHKEHWDNPEAFCPQRWEEGSPKASSCELRENNYVPFGVGPRSCPAKDFAKGFVKSLVVAFLREAEVTLPQNFVHKRRLRLGVPVVLWPSGGEKAQNHQQEIKGLLSTLNRRLENMVEEPDWGAGIGMKGIITMTRNNLRLGNGTFFCPPITGLHMWIMYQVSRLSRGFGRAAS